MYAGENFHQRGFSRAVIAHQGDHFAGMNLQLDIRQGGDRAEVFGDMTQF